MRGTVARRLGKEAAAIVEKVRQKFQDADSRVYKRVKRGLKKQYNRRKAAA